jgi:hypothetical protein
VIATLSASIAFAGVLIGYYLTYRNNLRLSLRQAALSFVSDQLRLLYGPMHAIVEANGNAYSRFLTAYPPSEGTSTLWRREPSAWELEMWRSWVIEVALPNNRRLYDLIQLNTHLLVDDEMPACLIDFCAHASGWEQVVSRWNRHDFDMHLSIV